MRNSMKVAPSISLSAFVLCMLLLLGTAPVCWAEGEGIEGVPSLETERPLPAAEPEQPAAEKEDKPTFNLYTDILSQYIWRGYALSKDSAVMQPSMTASYKGFSVNLWGNFDTDEAKGFGDKVGSANWNETDLTVAYSREVIKNLTVSAGGIYYAIVGPDSFELYAGLAYAFPWLTVGVTGYRELSHYPGWWVQFDLSRNFALPWYGMSLDLGATFIYQNSEDKGAYPNPGNPNKAYDDWHSGTILAALNIPVGKYVTISPRVGYAFPLTGKASDEISALSWDGRDNHVFGGLRVSAAF